MRLELHSRTGNAIVGVLGVVYLCGAVTLLVYDVAQTWGAASLMDRAIQFALILSATAGAFFAISAARNLSSHLTHPAVRRRPEGAVAVR